MAARSADIGGSRWGRTPVWGEGHRLGRGGRTMRWRKERPEVKKHRGAGGCAVARAGVVRLMLEQGYASALDLHPC